MAKYRRKPVFIEAEQYTDPSSVDRIMDMIGTTGVNNSPHGLYIFRGDEMIRVLKREFLIKYKEDRFFTLSEDEFLRLYERIDK